MTNDAPQTKYAYDDDILVAWLNYIERYFFREEGDGPPRARTGKKTPAAPGGRRAAWRRRARRNAAEKALWARTLAAGPSSGLAAFVVEHELTRLETRVVLTLLYANLQAEWTGRESPFRRGLVKPGEVIPRRPNAGIKNFRFFGPGSRLFERDLVAVHGFLTDPYFRISNKAFAALMGFPEREREHEEADRPARGRAAEVPLWEALDPRVTLEDVILPSGTREQLEDALYYARSRDDVLASMGLERVLEKGKGLALLFWGPPGTGKSMAAEAFAAALGVKVCVVRPERLESKWVGESEKNIARLFDAAAKDNAILVFDECDSFFFRRPSETGHYMNATAGRQVNMLLRGLEEGEGIYVLTTNRADYLDDAVARRLAAKIHFAPPDEECRLALWRRLLPTGYTLTDDDVRLLAARYAVAGGDIKQAVLASARRAGRAGRAVTLADVETALAGFQPATRRVGF